LVRTSISEVLLVVYGSATIFVTIAVFAGADLVTVAISCYVVARGMLFTGIGLKTKTVLMKAEP
jgi:hypothetical protein